MNIEVGNLKEIIEKMKRDREEIEMISNLTTNEILQKPNLFCLADETWGESENNTQSAKADNGKPNLSLVPKQIIYEMEKVRSFGLKKYKDPENWRKVEIERYHQAMLRHTLAVWDDINARDEESGLLHLSHIATNIAFILELMNDENK